MNWPAQHWQRVRILIDESLPRQLVPLLIGHDARMVQTEGWSSVKNGELLPALLRVLSDIRVGTVTHVGV